MNNPIRYFKMVTLIANGQPQPAMVTKYNPDTHQMCVYVYSAPKYGGMKPYWLDADSVIAAIASDGRVVVA